MIGGGGPVAESAQEFRKGQSIYDWPFTILIAAMEKPMTEVKHDRRTGRDRRKYSPHIHIPERRSGKDRRKSIIFNKRTNKISEFKESNKHIYDCSNKCKTAL